MRKNLRKLFLSLFAVVLTTSYVSAQLTLGARAGFNYTNMLDKYGGKKPDKDLRNKFKSGFQIGIVTDYELGVVVSIQSGLLFAQQGYKMDNNFYKEKLIVDLNYLQAPVNMQFKFPMGGIDLLIQTGPYFGFGINGKLKYWDENGKRMSDEDLKKLYGEVPKFSFGNNRKKNTMKGFDFGIGLGAGLQFGNIQAGFGYNIGIWNLAIKDRSGYDFVLKNRGLALTVTYLFGN